MSKYDFDTWFKSQLDYDLSEILVNGFDVVSDAELISSGFRPVELGFSKVECLEFAIRVKSLMTLLKFGLKDKRTLKSDWETFKPLCEILVNKKQMNEIILSLF